MSNILTGLLNEGAYEEGFSDGMNDSENPRSSSIYGPDIDKYRSGFRDGLKKREEERAARIQAYKDSIRPYLDIPTPELKQRMETAIERSNEIRNIYNKLRGASYDFDYKRHLPSNHEELSAELKRLNSEIEAIHQVLGQRSRKELDEAPSDPATFAKLIGFIPTIDRKTKNLLIDKLKNQSLVSESDDAEKQKYVQAAKDVLKGADPDHLIRVRNLNPEILRKHVDYAWDKFNKGEYKLNRPNLEEANKDNLIGGIYDPIDFDDMVLRVKSKAKKQEAEKQQKISMIADKIMNRIMVVYPDIIRNYGHEIVGDAIMNVAKIHKNDNLIGPNEISNLVREVKQLLDRNLKNLDEVSEKNNIELCGLRDPNVDEGEVKQFPKKHRSDLEDTYSCVKCGGDLQSGTYMGHKVKVCQPCKQVYLPPNTGIDQHGNKVNEQGVAEDTIRPNLVAALKGLGFKGPFKLEQLPEWMKELSDGRFDKDTSIMISGDDPAYDAWVAKGYDYGYAYGMESGYQTGLSAQEVFRQAKSDMQGVTEDSEPEGETVKNSLHTIIRVATHLERQIDDSEDFAEWESETIGSIKDQMVKVMDYEISKKEQQGLAESVNDYLWHGSKSEHKILYPRQAQDTGGAEGSNKNAVYATPNAKFAIAMGLTTPGSDTGMFPNDSQMVLFSGKLRKGEYVYLHKVPKDLFIKHNSREWYSKPGVEEVKPIEVVKVPVDKYLNLIRQATPQDLELRKKYMKQGVAEGSSKAWAKHNNLVDLTKPLAGLEAAFNDFLRTHDPEERAKYQQGVKQRIKTQPMSGPKGQLPEQGVAEGSDIPHWRVEQSEATGRYYVVTGYTDKSRKVWKNKLGAVDFNKKEDAEAKAQELNQGVAEGSGQNLSLEQLATISDEALDKAYNYGRSTPGNSFGWQANLMSAAYAKKMIDAGVTDIEKISDAIHKGWNVTAQKFVQNPDQFGDTEKLRQANKLEAKLAQRAKLMKINYAQLDNDEQEKDRVVARALLQAIKGQSEKLSESKSAILMGLMK